MGKAAKYLFAVNCFLTFVGLSVLISSAVARGRIPDSGWSNIATKQAATIGIVTGLFTLLLSVVGCVGAAAKQRKMMCCYLLGLSIILAFQIGAAVAMTNYSNALQISDFKAPSLSLTSTPDKFVNNYVFSVFMKCCSGCPGGYCNNTNFGGYSNFTLPNCQSNTTSCVQLNQCSPGSTSKCFVTEFPGDPLVVPPYGVQQEFCSGLSLIPVNGRYIVGPIDSKSCGAGNPAQFLQDMDAFLGTSLEGVAGFFTFVAVMEAFALVAGLYLIFCSAKSRVVTEDDDPVYV